MKKLLLMFALVVIVGCSVTEVTYHAKLEKDEFDGWEKVTTCCNFLPASTGKDKTIFDGEATISIDPMRFTSKTGNIIYSIKVHYGSKSWIFIESGESLIFLIDSERVSLTGEGSLRNRDVVYAGVIHETAYYDVDRSFLEKIANAKTVKMKLIGSRYYTERPFKPENQNNFKKFLAQY